MKTDVWNRGGRSGIGSEVMVRLSGGEGKKERGMGMGRKKEGDWRYLYS
jgi:hypothetical protein